MGGHCHLPPPLAFWVPKIKWGKEQSRGGERGEVAALVHGRDRFRAVDGSIELGVVSGPDPPSSSTELGILRIQGPHHCSKPLSTLLFSTFQVMGSQEATFLRLGFLPKRRSSCNRDAFGNPDRGPLPGRRTKYSEAGMGAKDAAELLGWGTTLL